MILSAKDAKEVAKASGKRTYQNWKKQRNESEEMGEGEFNKDETMREGLRLKFTQNEELKNKLLSTKNARLEEIGRFKGEYWTNKEQNRLGELLMDLRDELSKDI